MRRSDAIARAAAAVLFAFLTIAVGVVRAAPPPALVSIAVIPSNPSVPAGLSQQFTAIGQYSDDSSADLTSVLTWTSSFTPVATISDDPGSKGLASAIAPGTSMIRATDGTVSGSTVMTVTSPALVAIEVTPADSTITAGDTRQFTATGIYSNGSTQDLTATVTWSSDTPTTATISNAAGTRGLATGVAAGTTIITATLGARSGGTTLTVTEVSLVAIEIAPAESSVFIGLVRQFTATGIFSDGSTEDLTTAATWSSSVPAFATISNDAGSQGLATGVAAGMTVIQATLGTVTGGTTLTVTGPALVAIDVAPINPTVAAGNIRFMTAIGRFDDGSARNLTQTATWTSSVPAVATVSNDAGVRGRVTALAPGATQITARVGTVSGATTVTVPTELCSSGPLPCKTSGATTFTLRSEVDPRRNELQLTWVRGDATTAGELGDPTTDTQYTVCVWDRVGGTPTLVMEMTAPPGSDCGGRPCWRPIVGGGFRYNDPSLTPNGLRRLTLEPGPAGRSRVVVNGHGTFLPRPPMPFAQSPAITVQVVNDLGTCWGADYVSPLQRNTAQTLRARERP